MKKNIFAILQVIVLFSLLGCDGATKIRIRSQISEPLANECIESTLMSINGHHTVSKTNDKDVISSYFYGGMYDSGFVVQKYDELSNVFIEVSDTWLGPPFSLDKEIRIENNLLTVYGNLVKNCSNNNNIRIDSPICQYSSSYVWEKTCPSERK